MFELKTDTPRPDSPAAADAYRPYVQQLIEADSDYARFTISKDNLTAFRRCARSMGRNVEATSAGGGLVDVWLSPRVDGVFEDTIEAIQQWLTRRGTSAWQGTARQWQEEAQRDPATPWAVKSASPAVLGRRLRMLAKNPASGVVIQQTDERRGNTYTFSSTTPASASQPESAPETLAVA